MIISLLLVCRRSQLVPISANLLRVFWGDTLHARKGIKKMQGILMESFERVLMECESLVNASFLSALQPNAHRFIPPESPFPFLLLLRPTKCALSFDRQDTCVCFEKIFKRFVGHHTFFYSKTWQ